MHNQTYKIYLMVLVLFSIIIITAIAQPTGIIHSQNNLTRAIFERDRVEFEPNTTIIKNPVDVNDLNCRYGAAAWESTLPWLSSMGIGWYVNFGVTSNPIAGSEYVGVLRLDQDRDGDGHYLPTYTISPPLTDADFGAKLDASPGMLWLVGNEQDVAVQDNMYPEIYAQAYHEVYNYIRQHDPTAQVGIGGLSMATPGRLQYLDIVWDTYLDLYGFPMDVDVWNIHLYILSEWNPGIGRGDGNLALGTDPALAKNWPVTGTPYEEQCPLDNIYCRAEHDDLSIFAEQITDLRQWMKDHGQQNKPLILSEYGQLYPYIPEGNSCYLADEFGQCFTPDRVNNYMDETLSWLNTATSNSLGYPADNYKLVQQWLWFSMYVRNGEVDPNVYDSGGSSNLLLLGYNDVGVTPGDTSLLTEMGNNYRDHISADPLYVNLMAGTAAYPTAHIEAPQTGVTVTLSATFYNNGNTAVTDPFDVTFYADAEQTQIIGTATVTPTVNGCARNIYTVSMSWSDLTSGVHPYWVELNSDSAFPESNLSDNITDGFVIIDSDEVYLPLIMR